MSLVVKLWDDRGNEINGRGNLPVNLAVSAYGVGAFGVPELGAQFRFEIPQLNYISESMGFPTADIQLRNLPANRSLTLKVTATYTITGQETTSIPFGTGTARVAPLPPPAGSGGFNLSTVWWFLAGGLVILGGGWVALNSRYFNK